jgi:hypothetical protein
MKIVLVDNYNRDSVADVLIAEKVQPREFGELLVELLNKRPPCDGWFVLRSDNYRLCRGMEDLV